MGAIKGTRRTIRHAGGIIYPHGAGKFRATINYNYRKHRAVLDTIEDAKAWIDATQAELGNALPPLDAFQIREAARAMAILPEGISLIEAAQFWRARHSTSSIPLDDAIREYRQQRESEGLRARSRQSASHKLLALSDAHPDAQIHQVTTKALLKFLEERGVAGITRNNYRRDLSGFFSWAVRAGYIERNPATTIPVVKLDERLPGILTPTAIGALLRAATDHAPEMAPLIAVMAFAGIRPEEARRLLWSDILLDQELIRIGPHVAKMRQQRYVDIHPTLAAWLKDHATTLERIAPWAQGKTYSVLRDLRTRAEIDVWPGDALRHSFATYHLAIHEDPGLTARQLGHRNTATLFRHYRGLATRQEAEQFWKLTPTAVAELAEATPSD